MAVALLASSGCGQRVVRVPVEGVVTLDGAPLAEIAVTFMPRFPGLPGIAITDAAGRFVLQDARMQAGIPPGDYDVVVFSLDGEHEGSPSSGARLRPGKVPPERYRSPQTSGLHASISKPTTDLEFALTTKSH